MYREEAADLLTRRSCPFCTVNIPVTAWVCPNCHREVPRPWSEELEPPCRLCQAKGQTVKLVVETERLMRCPVCKAARVVGHRRGREVTLSQMSSSPAGPTAAPAQESSLGGLALLFAFLVPIVGLILGIIAVSRGPSSSGVAAIILSIIMPIIYIAACTS